MSHILLAPELPACHRYSGIISSCLQKLDNTSVETNEPEIQGTDTYDRTRAACARREAGSAEREALKRAKRPRAAEARQVEVEFEM